MDEAMILMELQEVKRLTEAAALMQVANYYDDSETHQPLVDKCVERALKLLNVKEL